MGKADLMMLFTFEQVEKHDTLSLVGRKINTSPFHSIHSAAKHINVSTSSYTYISYPRCTRAVIASQDSAQISFTH